MRDNPRLETRLRDKNIEGIPENSENAGQIPPLSPIPLHLLRAPPHPGSAGPSDANLPGGEFGKNRLELAAAPGSEEGRHHHFGQEIAFVPAVPQLHVQVIDGLYALFSFELSGHTRQRVIFV